MFKVGDRIKLKKHIIKEYSRTGKRPYYFNTYGDMDYMLRGETITVVGKKIADSNGRARVQVAAQKRHRAFNGTWTLLMEDCELEAVDNRKIKAEDLL